MFAALGQPAFSLLSNLLTAAVAHSLHNVGSEALERPPAFLAGRCRAAGNATGAKPMHPALAANGTHPGLVLRIHLMGVYPNGPRRSSIFCRDPSVGQ